VPNAAPPKHRLQQLLKKGMKLHREGRLELARGCYQKILKADPLSAEAQQLARVLQPESSPAAKAIFVTDNAETLAQHAAAYLAQGKLQQALESCKGVVKLRPDSFEAHQRLGEMHERLGDLPAALDCYRRALELQPDSPDLHCHLARVLGQGRAFQPAAELYRRALTLDPQRQGIYSDLAYALTELGDLDAALEAFKRALRLAPRSPKTIASLGHFFERKGDLLSAADAYREAVKLDPQLHAAYLDLGFVLYGLGELAEASDCLRRLLAQQPDSWEAKAQLALIQLLQGDMPGGWATYESRWQVGVGDERRFFQPQWKGERLNGARILLYAEQGLGDTLQFVRYVPLVAARGGEVLLEVQPSLHDLLTPSEGASRVIRRGETLPEFTWQCPLMSLPLAFKTELNSIPASVPYIHPDATRVASWRERLAGNTRRIGLAWAGRPEHPRDRWRSLPLEQLVPLLNVPGTTFYSLQVGAGAEQVQQLPPDVRLVDLAAEVKDFANTAAAVANLDLVISIDSAMVHLAGAMGKPVWVLLNKGCDWRWLLDRADSPWYPTARLFRQTTPGEWQEPVKRIERELRQDAT